MNAKLLQPETEKIAVAKPDLVAAWALMERVVVSLRKMGSYYSTPGPDVPLPPEKQREMLREWAGEWTGLMQPAAAQAKMEEMKTNISETWFAWSGPTEKGSAAYFRILIVAMAAACSS